MNNIKNMSEGNENNINVSVDVTKIVKYSCISSVIIVFIVFGTKLFRDVFRKRD